MLSLYNCPSFVLSRYEQMTIFSASDACQAQIWYRSHLTIYFTLFSIFIFLLFIGIFLKLVFQPSVVFIFLEFSFILQMSLSHGVIAMIHKSHILMRILIHLKLSSSWIAFYSSQLLFSINLVTTYHIRSLLMMLNYSLILEYETKKLESSAIKANWSGVWGKGVLGRMDTFIYMAESLRCSHGTITTLNRLCVCVCVCVCVCKVTQSCPTLCDPVDCSPPGPSVHGIS